MSLPELCHPERTPGVVCHSITDTSGTNCGAIFGEQLDARGSWIKDADPDNIAAFSHRYVMWRIWEHTKQPLVNIGLNPSTATHLVLDNTVRRDLGYARAWGYGGLVKLNLFSLRSTDPSALSLRQTKSSVTGGIINDEYLAYFTDPVRAGMVLCAWGVHGELYGRGVDVEEMLRLRGVPLYALGFCKNSEPRHTLYLSKDLKPERWTP
jgi:hypothetical protein